MYDIIIIGAGIVGAAVVRQLSQYVLKMAVLEANADAAMGSSGANSAIVHAGYDCPPSTLMAETNVLGNLLYDQWKEDLDIPFERIGSLVLGFDEADVEKLQQLYEQGLQNGVPGIKMITKEEAVAIEPSLSSEVIAALYAPSAGITCPYQVTVALLENAVENGAELFFEHTVTGIKKTPTHFVVETEKASFEAKIIINCAGQYADRIAQIAGAESYTILPRKGEYCLYDKKMGQTVRHVLFQTPSAMGKGVLVTPTVDGNLLTGPTAEDISDKEDIACTQEGLEHVFRQSLKSVPALKQRDIIRVFSGLRASLKQHDFMIEASKKIDCFIHVSGICSPGLSAAPAIALKVRDLVQAQMTLTPQSHYQPKRRAIVQFSACSREEQEGLIKKNPRYGRVVCRCETVTEAEIVEAINRPVPALTVDAIKRRTRSSMGRCQGGFCTPRIMEILAREKGIAMSEITKSGEGSSILVGTIKEGKKP